MAMRIHFNEALDELGQDIVRMSTIVEESINKAVDAFETKNVKTAEEVIENDRKINNLQLTIEDKCNVLIATEQPVAGDLRLIITAIKLAGNLERIGDHAVHLAKTTIRLSGQQYIDKVTGLIPKMADIGLNMVREAVNAFVQKDVEKAKAAAVQDRQIDILHKEVFQILINTMKERTDTIEQATDLLFINRFMERLGDHVASMCEWVVFAMTGEHIELN